MRRRNEGFRFIQALVMVALIALPALDTLVKARAVWHEASCFGR